jgi:hypothetical protein
MTLSVDEQYLLAYRQIAVLLLKNLFAVDLGAPKPAPTLERLIMLWNRIEETLTKKLTAAGITHRHTFFWEEATLSGVIDHEDIRRLTELRMIRNAQVHSSDINRADVARAVSLAENLLAKLG